MSRNPLVSVVIPTRDRADTLDQTLRALRDQTLPASAYEIVVVDDGSTPPVSAPRWGPGPGCTVVRLPGRERSAARNAGARAACGKLLVFVDDDIIVPAHFLRSHAVAHEEWPGALVVGAVYLPREVLQQPFGRFRQELEQRGLPRQRGVTDVRNFCTAQNMSLSRARFLEMDGFDEGLVSAEDQDLALRHSRAGGAIVFLPEAVGIHRDAAMDVRSYCRRIEWGYERIVAFCRKHPTWPDNIARERVNGGVRLGREPVRESLHKLGKRLGALRAVLGVLFAAVAIVERVAPTSSMLDRLYRALLGVHIYRGYRRGGRRSVGGEPDVLSRLSPGRG